MRTSPSRSRSRTHIPGVQTWTLQSRPVGAVPWTTVASGTGAGSKSPDITGVEGTRTDYRVVVTDKQGNRRISPSRRVYIPTDGDSLGAEAVITPDPPTEDPGIDAFGGSYTQIDTLTYTWAPGSDCLFEIIASSSGTWQILVSADGNPTVVHADLIPDAPRATVYSDNSCATVYEVFVSNASGPFPLDAILGAP